MIICVLLLPFTDELEDRILSPIRIKNKVLIKTNLSHLVVITAVCSEVDILIQIQDVVNLAL